MENSAKHRFVSRCASVLTVLALLAMVPLGSAATFTVGGDGACGYSDLQVALLATLLNGPGADTIRVARNQTYLGEYLIDNQSVSIVGGYDDCSDSTASGRTVISRAYDERAFKIAGTTNGIRTIELVNLDIRYDGAVSAILNEGGTLHITGGHIVTLQNTNIDGGTAARGGGIWVDASILVLNDLSSVLFNHATMEGGGIACTNGGTIGLLSGVVANNAADDGAGVHLTGGCTLNNYLGGTLQGIFLNVAGGDGGGIWAGGGSTVNVIGQSSHPAVVTDNDADRGAGLFLTGSGTQATITDSQITMNDATTSGGGIFAENQAGVTMERTLGSDCHDTDRCSQLTSNTAAGTTGGAALFVDSGATVAVRQTYIEGSTAPSVLGSVAYVGGVGGSEMRFEGVVVAGNQGNNVVLIGDGGLFEAGFMTSTANNTSSFYSNTAVNSTARFFSSIIHNGTFGGVIYGGGVNGATHFYDCLIVHNDLGLEAGDLIVVTDPGFVNYGAGDYHLRSDSAAIDFCDTTFFTPIDNDIDDEGRGFDDPSIPNTVGTFDLGADEVRTPAGLIFSDGFESATTGAWSAVAGE